MYCRRCGTPLHTGIVICPECGARQRRQATSVRCASCHSRIPVTLSICPHCGRDVRPAGPRWGIWLVIAIGLVVMVLWGLGKLPIEQIGQEITGVKTKVAGLVQVLGPAPTAEPSESKTQTIARGTVAAPPTVATAEIEATAAPEPELTEVTEGVEKTFAEPSATAAISATLEAPSPGAQAITATVATVPTLAPTSTPAPTATAVPPTATQPAPTATVAATKAAGSQVISHRVRAGDTLSGIAQQYQVSLDALLSRQPDDRSHHAAHRPRTGHPWRRSATRADRHTQTAGHPDTDGSAAHACSLSAGTDAKKPG